MVEVGEIKLQPEKIGTARPYFPKQSFYFRHLSFGNSCFLIAPIISCPFGGREYLALAVAGGDRVHGGVAINEGRREVQPLQFLDVLMDR